MYIRVVSDLHLEFRGEVGFILPPLLEDSETVLVLAGDIVSCEWVRRISSRFYHVIYVLGNHEFYDGDLNITPRVYKANLSDLRNVTILDNESIVLGDVRFIGSTLWSDFDGGNPLSMLNAQRCMTDYDLITVNDRKIIPQDILLLHDESVNFIAVELDHPIEGKKDIIVTHHIPTFQAVHNEFRMSEINGAYASDLDRIIHYYKMPYWFFGHTHLTTSVEIGSTKVYNNPLGYYQIEENFEFKPYFRVEV